MSVIDDISEFADKAVARINELIDLCNQVSEERDELKAKVAELERTVDHKAIAIIERQGNRILQQAREARQATTTIERLTEACKKAHALIEDGAEIRAKSILGQALDAALSNEAKP